jgi:hypothetical protein
MPTAAVGLRPCPPDPSLVRVVAALAAAAARLVHPDAGDGADAQVGDVTRL